MKQPVSLIALDMDGTLLTDKVRSQRRIRTPFAKLPPAEFTLPYRPDALTPGFPSHFYPVSASPMPSPPTVLPSIICRIASASMNLRWSLRLYAPSSKNCKKRASIWMLLSMATASASVPVRERSTAWTCPHQSNATFTGPEPSPMISLPISASTI